MSHKSILITGCSSGIGYDAAHGLRARGWRVFASCRKAEDCTRLSAEGFESPLIDYQDEAFACPGLLEDLSSDGLRDIFQANFFGWHELTRQVIPTMRAQGHGRIVQCSSVLGIVTLPFRGAYVSTKFALEGLSDTLRIEMKDTGIHVILIEPGPVTSHIRKNAIPHFERWIDWEASPRAEAYRVGLKKRLYESSGPDRFELPASAVTKKLIHAIESPRPRPRYYVTTPTYLMGTMRRLLPTRLLDWILAKA